MSMFEEIHIQFAKTGDGSVNIRKWSQFPFDGAEPYAAMTQQEKTSNPAPVSQMTALTDEQIGRAELKLMEVLSGYNYVMPLDGMRQVLEAAGETPPSPQMTGPQDISTAPKMTDVLVWWPIVQLDEDGEPTEEVVDGRWIISEDQGGYWIEPDVMNAIGDHLGDDFTYAAQPSHWMPLPAPLFVPAEDQP